MVPFISLLPFMPQPDDVHHLLERWDGGIELVTDGPNWHEQTDKALLDVGHAHINGWDIPRVIQDLGEHLQAVHLHDNDGLRDLHLPIGEGTIDWSEVWAALGRLRHPWRAILEYEVGTPIERLLEDAHRLPMLLEGQVSKSVW